VDTEERWNKLDRNRLDAQVCESDLRLSKKIILPPFQNIRCFRFVKQLYLDIF
jgi:hypothetical protein